MNLTQNTKNTPKENPSCFNSHKPVEMVEKKTYERAGVKKYEIKFRFYNCKVTVTEYHCPECGRIKKYCVARPLLFPNFEKSWFE